MKLQNELFSRGLMPALEQLMSLEFPEDMGDFAWELACAYADLERQKKAHDEMVKRIYERFDKERSALLKEHYGDDAKLQDLSEKEVVAFDQEESVKAAVDAYKQAMEEHNKKDMEHKSLKPIQIRKKDLKRLKGVRPIHLALIRDILDVRG